MMWLAGLYRERPLLEAASTIFGKERTLHDTSKKFDDLYRQIGEVTVERDWLKKKLQNCL